MAANARVPGRGRIAAPVPGQAVGCCAREPGVVSGSGVCGRWRSTVVPDGETFVGDHARRCARLTNRTRAAIPVEKVALCATSATAAIAERRAHLFARARQR